MSVQQFVQFWMYLVMLLVGALCCFACVTAAIGAASRRRLGLGVLLLVAAPLPAAWAIERLIAFFKVL